MQVKQLIAMLQRNKRNDLLFYVENVANLNKIPKKVIEELAQLGYNILKDMSETRVRTRVKKREPKLKLDLGKKYQSILASKLTDRQKMKAIVELHNQDIHIDDRVKKVDLNTTIQAVIRCSRKSDPGQTIGQLLNVIKENPGCTVKILCHKLPFFSPRNIQHTLLNLFKTNKIHREEGKGTYHSYIYFISKEKKSI